MPSFHIPPHQVNDALIASICRSVGPRLRALRVCHCAHLTDACLAFLTRSYCPRLETLDLTGIVLGGREGAPMSEAAVAALRAATHATVRTHALPGVL